jgi:HEAT repeat protein
MDYSLTFARHFARLVWLLLNEGNAFDAQIATLRSLVNVSRDGDVRITSKEWRLMANGQPLPDRFTGAQDLVAQLIGHSVTALCVSQGASPADLLLAARVLASEAMAGDGGHNVLERLASLGSRTVNAEIEGGATAAALPKLATPARSVTPPMSRPAFGSTSLGTHDDDAIIAITADEEMFGAASLASAPTGAEPASFIVFPALSPVTPPTPPAMHAVPAIPTMPMIPVEPTALSPTPSAGLPEFIPPDALVRQETPPSPFAPGTTFSAPLPAEEQSDEPAILRGAGADPEALTNAFAPGATPKGTMVKTFEALDAAPTSAAAARQLDILVKLASESARKERVDMVADIFYGIVKREAEVADKTITRQLAMSIRRLSTPSVLQCLVELLPRRRENYEQYMAVFEKAEETGVEALVEALVAAPSIADRRVYYDALLRLRSGIRTLMFMLGDPRWYVVRNAAELLGEMKSAEAEADLTKLLQHRDDRVRTAAAAALAKLGGTAAVRGMRSSLKDASAGVRERMSQAIAAPRNDGSSVESIIRALDREEDSRVQMAMLAALGQLGTPAAVDKLLEIARSDKKLLTRARPTPMRVAAVHALGDVKNTTAMHALQALMHDKEKDVRGAASWVVMGRRRENGQWPEDDGAEAMEPQ